MSFVAAPPLPASPAVADMVGGDGWYPQLGIAAFRDAMRVGGTVTAARAREALIGGMLSAAVDLQAWRAGQEAAGITSLAAASTIQLGGESRAVILWRRAVHAFAMADLVETHGEISATEAGRDQREAQAASADDHRRNATMAIRDLVGRTRSKVTLV